jgi:hypothetical protein
MLRDLVVAIETLVIVGLTIAVEIAEADDLIAARDVDQSVHDFQSEWLEEPRRDALPRQTSARVVDSADSPDVTVPRADGGGSAAVEEIETAGSDQTMPRIFHRDCEVIDCEAIILRALDCGGRQHSRPSARAAAGQDVEPRWGSLVLREPTEILGLSSRYQQF